MPVIQIPVIENGRQFLLSDVGLFDVLLKCLPGLFHAILSVTLSCPFVQDDLQFPFYLPEFDIFIVLSIATMFEFLSAPAVTGVIAAGFWIHNETHTFV
jgi:hypothetical protein